MVRATKEMAKAHRRVGHGHHEDVQGHRGDDVNECTEQPPPAACGRNRECRNTRGSYDCVCVAGYREPPPGEGEDCLDVDECVMEPARCGRGAECINTPGSYQCRCPPRLHRCPPRRRLPRPVPPPRVCLHASVPPGALRPGALVADVDECQASPELCRSHGLCVNRPGGFACACAPGFGKSSRDPLHVCTDVDECRQPVCGAVARCHNTAGSYACVCPPGQGVWLAGRAACESAGGHPGRGAGPGDAGAGGGGASPSPRGHRAAGRHRGAGAEGGARLPEATVTVTSANGTELRLAVRHGPPRGPLRLQDPQVQLEVPGEVAADGDTGWALAALLSAPALGRALEGAARVRWGGWERLGPPGARGPPSYRLLSPVASAFVARPRPPGPAGVALRFAHPPPDPRRGGELLCAFWHPEHQVWATDGCRVVATASDPPGSACACDHLTSFAVLLAFYEPQAWALDVVTKVGLSLSLLCLLLAIVTFVLCRALQGPRTTIHLHLCACLFVAHGTFLLGVERTANRAACAAVAGLLHFSFVAAFCWMGLEGLHLYVLLVRVFAPAALRPRHLLLAGYGPPALVVAVAAAIFPQGYGTEQHCWLSLERGFRWSFRAPVCIIIAINAIIFVITIWKLVQKFSDINPDMGHLRRMRVMTVTAVAQLCLLGTTWVLGLFQLGPRSLALSYLFTLLNCTQGVFILVLHCLAHRQVRDMYRAWLCPGAKRYSEFSTSSTSGGGGGGSSTRVPRQESGM
ncbi:LOW QUALITY PROTEIN: adhesion G protein-coupled receptor E5-like [Apteryx mantelli]|uniref:LOW QUALITY PROTEIN: adhesion G protein-coupled receptor E5-like n=1 Tax=Apteryx mantelli TaxID=2696672 RepID=A0ABM4G7S5_9AVES